VRESLDILGLDQVTEEIIEVGPDLTPIITKGGGEGIISMEEEEKTVDRIMTESIRDRTPESALFHSEEGTNRYLITGRIPGLTVGQEDEGADRCDVLVVIVNEKV